MGGIQENQSIKRVLWGFKTRHYRFTCHQKIISWINYVCYFYITNLIFNFGNNYLKCHISHVFDVCFLSLIFSLFQYCFLGFILSIQFVNNISLFILYKLFFQFFLQDFSVLIITNSLTFTSLKLFNTYSEICSAVVCTFMQ